MRAGMEDDEREVFWRKIQRHKRLLGLMSLILRETFYVQELTLFSFLYLNGMTWDLESWKAGYGSGPRALMRWTDDEDDGCGFGSVRMDGLTTKITLLAFFLSLSYPAHTDFNNLYPMPDLSSLEYLPRFKVNTSPNVSTFDVMRGRKDLGPYDEGFPTRTSGALRTGSNLDGVVVRSKRKTLGHFSRLVRLLGIFLSQPTRSIISVVTGRRKWRFSEEGGIRVFIHQRKSDEKGTTDARRVGGGRMVKVGFREGDDVRVMVLRREINSSPRAIPDKCLNARPPDLNFSHYTL
ncbi:hypothetical protein SCHPADRAFT_889685 [Schizopora paradoxa]|uniref:Uncharacterized protein n=1 Tax=Schizopora paradoxa TaxID=27342 RepID=A0A0H2SAM5_9AGAM|nr:hypothetical protein SCHPADRAFT_889685 [Schizopora paradoxa]